MKNCTCEDRSTFENINDETYPDPATGTPTCNCCDLPVGPERDYADHDDCPACDAGTYFCEN